MKADRTKISWEGRLFRYFALLLIVAVLFTGVTFARFASKDEGNITTGVARFDPTFTVDGVNSVTYGNLAYWQSYNGQWIEQGKGSARTVRISMQNNGDVDAMPAVIHMEGPAEYWESIALQLTTAKSDGSADVTLTTQYVIADLLRVRNEVEDENGKVSEHEFTYGEYINWGENGTTTTFDTSVSDYFDQRGSGEEVLKMSVSTTKDSNGDIESRTVTAVRDTESSYYQMPLTIQITATMKEVEYSVGFMRKQNNASLPAFYLDCKKEVPYYSIDITLPQTAQTSTQAGNPFVVEADESSDYDGLILFMTWTNSIREGDLGVDVYKKDAPLDDTPDDTTDDTTLTWTALQNLVKNGGGTALTFNGATVIGYHYNHIGVPTTKGESTTVRINTRFTFDEDDQVTGSTVTYQHVANIQENEGQYPHDLEEKGNNYVCTGKNYVTIDGGIIDGLATDVNPDEFSYTANTDSITATEKGYNLSFGITFIQASEQPTGGTSTQN